MKVQPWMEQAIKAIAESDECLDYGCLMVGPGAQKIAEFMPKQTDLITAAKSLLAIKYKRECTHDSEYDICDACFCDYQKETAEAMSTLKAAVEAEEG